MKKIIFLLTIACTLNVKSSETIIDVIKKNGEDKVLKTLDIPVIKYPDYIFPTILVSTLFINRKPFYYYDVKINDKLFMTTKSKSLPILKIKLKNKNATNESSERVFYYLCTKGLSESSLFGTILDLSIFKNALNGQGSLPFDINDNEFVEYIKFYQIKQG